MRVITFERLGKKHTAEAKGEEKVKPIPQACIIHREDIHSSGGLLQLAEFG